MALHAEDTTHLRSDNHLANLSTILYNLYETSTLVDVTIACDQGNLYAHKIILSASSPFFAEIFASNPCEHPVVVLKYVHCGDMKAILEYMYRGQTEIEAKSLKRILHITKELEVKGLEKLEYMNSMNMIPNTGTIRSRTKETAESGTYGTRFKGTKRVMVNFEEGFGLSSPKKANSTTSSVSKDLSGSDMEPLLIIAKEVGYESDLNDHSKMGMDMLNLATNDQKNTTVYFDCKQCIKTFKNRNQLLRHMAVHRGKTFRRVHTGERPYECRQCGRAFARQDKLKLHVIKSHEMTLTSDSRTVSDEILLEGVADDFSADEEEEGDDGDGEYRPPPGVVIGGLNGKDDGRGAGRGNGFQIGQVQEDYIRNSSTMHISSDREHYTLEPPKLPPGTSITSINGGPNTSTSSTSASASTNATSVAAMLLDSCRKRGRGRPRKYPPKPEPIRKRPHVVDDDDDAVVRMRKAAVLPTIPSRAKSAVVVVVARAVAMNPPGQKRGRGRPRKSITNENNDNNYNLNNLPFGDLSLLTMPLKQEMIEMTGDVSIDSAGVADDRAQDPLQIVNTKHDKNVTEITARETSTPKKVGQKECVVLLTNKDDIYANADNQRSSNNAAENIDKNDSSDKSDSLRNDNGHYDNFAKEKVDSCDRDAFDSCCEATNDSDTSDKFSSHSMESLTVHSNSSLTDFDIKAEPMSDKSADISIDENQIDSQFDSCAEKGKSDLSVPSN